MFGPKRRSNDQNCTFWEKTSDRASSEGDLRCHRQLGVAGTAADHPCQGVGLGLKFPACPVGNCRRIGDASTGCFSDTCQLLSNGAEFPANSREAGNRQAASFAESAAFRMRMKGRNPPDLAMRRDVQAPICCSSRRQKDRGKIARREDRAASATKTEARVDGFEGHKAAWWARQGSNL